MQRGAGSEKKKKGAVVELSKLSKPVGEVEVEEAVVQPKQVTAFFYDLGLCRVG